MKNKLVLAAIGLGALVIVISVLLIIYSRYKNPLLPTVPIVMPSLPSPPDKIPEISSSTDKIPLSSTKTPQVDIQKRGKNLFECAYTPEDMKIVEQPFQIKKTRGNTVYTAGIGKVTLRGIIIMQDAEIFDRPYKLVKFIPSKPDVEGPALIFYNEFSKPFYVHTTPYPVEFTLGILENGGLSSTAEFSKITEKEIIDVLDKGQTIELTLTIPDRGQDGMGVGANYSAACKIESPLYTKSGGSLVTYVNKRLGIQFTYPSNWGNVNYEPCYDSTDPLTVSSKCQNITLEFTDLNDAVFLSSSSVFLIQYPPERGSYWGDSATSITNENIVRGLCSRLRDNTKCKVYENSKGVLIARYITDACTEGGCNKDVIMYEIKAKNPEFLGIVISTDRLKYAGGVLRYPAIPDLEKKMDELVDSLKFL